jgi:hypothetical protein
VLASTDGIVEYRATTFRNAMRGNIIMQRWNAETYRAVLSEDGLSLLQLDISGTQNFPSLFSLDVVTGPGGVLIGIDYTGNKIVSDEPVDADAQVRPTSLFFFPLLFLNFSFFFLQSGTVCLWDIHPWRAPRTGGTPFVIGGANFPGTIADVTVEFGGVQATLSSKSGNRIRGTVPVFATPDLVDVVVTFNTIGTTLSIPKAFRFL